MPKCCPVGYIFDLSRGCVEDVDELCKARCFNDVSEKQGTYPFLLSFYAMTCRTCLYYCLQVLFIYMD